MHNNSQNFYLEQNRNPLGSFFLLLFFFLCCLFLGQLLALSLVKVLFHFDNDSLIKVFDGDEAPEGFRIPLYILQGFTAFAAFIVAPLIYLKFWEKRSLSTFFKVKLPQPNVYLITFFLVISFMFVNSFFVEWNAQLTLPEFLKGFEEWAYEKEQQAKLLTEFLTDFQSFNQFLIGLLIIAVIPAIGEELLFRGLIQPQMYGMSKNIHVAIWVTGFLFSAMHLQFYGLIPRMLLGVLFGYMYYWSGNIIIPILGHFINNGFTLTMLYLYQLKTIDYDLETETSVPWYVSLTGMIAGSLLLFYFYRYFQFREKLHE